MHTDILIVGAGLSGLALADRLLREGLDVQVVEARNRLGGRIKTAEYGGEAFDLGPAWFWQGQIRTQALAARFGIPVFTQFDTGDFLLEDAPGALKRYKDYAPMAGSFRLDGGFQALIAALATDVDASRIILGAKVVTISSKGNFLECVTEDGSRFSANRVVLALPPRLAEELQFEPSLPANARTAMRSIPTWMAGHAKAVAIYDDAFWRADGLSGDAMSRVGPLAEIHDASPNSEGFGALFGFFGISAAQRQSQEDLHVGVLSQFERIFGPQESMPKKVWIEDWALEPHTATRADHIALRHHPRYGMPPVLRGIFDGRLLFAGTEMAPEFGGFVEGALEAAEIVANGILRTVPENCG